MEKNRPYLLSAESARNDTIKIGMKDSTPIEKGVILNEFYLEKNEKSLGDVMSIFTAYPDVFLDLIRPADSYFTLFFY
jgi:hypothetical protein